MQAEQNRKAKNQEKELWLTVSEVSEKLRCHEQSIRKMIHSGRLPAVQIGSTYRVLMSDLVAALAAR